MDKRVVLFRMKELEDKLYKRIQRCLENPNCCICSVKEYLGINKIKELVQKDKRGVKSIYTGKILHLDGDKRYSDKSAKYYKSLGLNAVVKNIPENKQASVIKSLLEKYNPDILVITGHDGMIKKGTSYNDIYNYRNSRHYINAVNEARKWTSKGKDLAIFARSLPKLL